MSHSTIPLTVNKNQSVVMLTESWLAKRERFARDEVATFVMLRKVYPLLCKLPEHGRFWPDKLVERAGGHKLPEAKRILMEATNDWKGSTLYFKIRAEIEKARVR